MRQTRGVMLLLTTVFVCTGAILQAHAGGVVTDCSKFGAVGEPGTFANELQLGGDVTFACNGTIIVPKRIDISTDTQINANGYEVILTSIAEGIQSIFWILEGKKLDLIGLKCIGGTYSYGAIRNLGGIVTLNDCLVSENTAQYSVPSISNQNWGESIGKMTLNRTIVSKNTGKDASAGAIFNSAGDMTLVDSTVSENSVVTSEDIGTSVGGIHNNLGTLTLINSTISQNRGGNGGGIGNYGKMTLQNSRVINNSAESKDQISGNGGGIFCSGNNTTTIINSEISGNTAENRGGGLSLRGGNISIENSTISNNHSLWVGGGIIAGTTSILTVKNSTLSGNTAGDLGGGLYNFNTEGSTTLTNTTFSGNSAAEGGGLHAGSPSLTLTHVTFSGNSATDKGSNLNLTNITEMSNTLITGGIGATNCDIIVASSLIDSGYNLSDDDSCRLTNVTSMSGTAAGIDVILADNGGLTQTHALLSDSLALNKIPFGINGCGDSITTDQRGVLRPQWDFCDIGAYELEETITNQPPVVSDVKLAPNPAPPNTPVKITATIDDTATGNSNIKSAEYSVDGGDWMPMMAGDGTFDSPVEQVTAETSFTETGLYSIFVRGTDTFSDISSNTQCDTLAIQQSVVNPIHVENIDGVIKVGKKYSTFTASVKVTDENNKAVRGVTVSATITTTNTVNTLTAITSRTGIAMFRVNSSNETSWEICVTDLQSSTYTYDESADKETCDEFGLETL